MAKLPSRLRFLTPWVPGVALWLVCFAIAVWGGFPRLFLQSLPIYLASLMMVGLVHVLSFLPREYVRTVLRTKCVASVDATAVDQSIDWWARRACDNKATLVYSAIVLLVQLPLLNYAWLNYARLSPGHPLLFIDFMPKGWYEGYLFPKLLIVNLIAVAVLSSAVVCVRGLILLMVGTGDWLSRLELRSPFLVRQGFVFFKELDRLNLSAALWFMAPTTATLVIVVIHGVGPMGIFLITVLGGVTGATYIVPHYLYLRKFEDARKYVLNLVLNLSIADLAPAGKQETGSTDEGELLSRMAVYNFLLSDLASLRTSKDEALVWARGLGLLLFSPAATIVIRVLSG